MRINQADGAGGADDADGRPKGADPANGPEPNRAEPNRAGPEAGDDKSARGDGPPPTDGAARTEQVIAYRSEARAIYRAYAIDQGCAEVEKIETDTTTPAMLRIEAEDPDRRLVGLDNRLKGKNRLAEKVESWKTAQPGLTPDDAFRLAKDAIRYSFVYEEAKYTVGVYADCRPYPVSGIRAG